MTVRRILLLGFLGVVAVATLMYAARRSVLNAIGGFLIASDSIHPAEAIVVLSGSLPDRILEGVDLYQAHMAPRIILTRQFSLPGLAALRQRGGNLPEPHEENLMVAQQLGIPEDAISLLPTAASSTLAEAHLVISFLQAQRIKSILLVTSGAHTRRAGMIFRRLAQGRIDIAVCPSPYDPFTPEDWWHDRSTVRHVVTEYGKLLTYLLIDRWRSLPQSSGDA
ncbi:MAG: YdcF family protein [Candidatus Binatia bacterium]